MTPENPTEKLEPCPFCQSHDVYVRKIGTHGESNAVRCRGCGCHGPLRATPADALASWNTRPPLAVSETPPDERADVLAVRAVLAGCAGSAEEAEDIEAGREDWSNRFQDALEGYRTFLSTHPEPSPDEHPANSAGQGDGWQLVPVEITQAMLDATCCDDADDRQMRETWKALLHAAPIATPTETAQQNSGGVERLREALTEAVSLLRKVAASKPDWYAGEMDVFERKVAALTPPKPVDTDTGVG